MIIVNEPLDISQLPPFQLVAVDYDTERANLIAGVVARFAANGVPYDAQLSEADSAVILSEEFAYRKTLDLAALNDAGKRLTVAFGYGAALDHIAATYYADIGVARLPAPGVASPRPYAVNPEDWETDDRFRRRIQLAPDARTPGTLRGYEYWALTAAPALIDARAFNYASGLCSTGQIVVVVLGRDVDLTKSPEEQALQEPAQLALAQNLILNRNTKLGTDEVAVRAATRLPVTVNATIGIKHGPDPSIIISIATANLQKYIAFCQSRIGEIFAESGQKAALFPGGPEYAHLAVNSDIDPGPDGVVKVTIGTITTEYVGV